ncbi:acyl-CoA dehydrogenase [Mycolicibacterium moriokaense]|uniref:Acyl-CoA dehydrogenase n=1 Tax=Mycolicibacterium moriokaense TaxID=39691 RepID=A0AAD1HG35_9MYCO|nr:acyl-CoA dehydrogenase family protein [Mycolicibacterium moriokaense]MCV7041971.1 acyl-CoA dehydrogenase family protein [Mycolicibacterium moriokaense]ORB25227.1 acyl-CoA dehydrogenase [Mycolicibacterium moriokaense]BBX04738.1 acyl-CoA dehydrogenase [Mycolicibacterium moriokaense]
MHFAFVELSAEELRLQQAVREFLMAELPRGQFEPGLGMGAPRDREFSRKLARHGWLGMGLPSAYGGADRTAVERFIVTEELLRWGAPVGHHWIADRQSGAVIARYGTESQKLEFLPKICSGEIAFCVGMSEPDSGSDLAAISTRATRVDGGWEVNGTKVWTSGADESDWMIALVRTSNEDDKHRGLSQLIIDLRSAGVRISPISTMTGAVDFCEVSLTAVFVPDSRVLGSPGAGWEQVTSELVYERGGPERWLSTYIVVEGFVRTCPPSTLGAHAKRVLGGISAKLWGLRNMSLSTARALDEGRLPAAEASLVKEMATRYEQDMLELIRGLVDIEPTTRAAARFDRLLAHAVLNAPIFTIRGGTVEILRKVVAKDLAHA